MHFRRAARTLLFAASITLPCSLASRDALAEPTPEAVAKAAQLKELGNQAMDRLNHQQALAYYAEAYGLTQDPALLFNKGRALEGLGDIPGALAAQEEFAAKASPELKAKVPMLDKLIEDLRARVAVVELHVTPPDAEVRANDRVLGSATAKTFQLNAGNVKLHIVKEGFFPADRDITLQGGRTTVLDITLLSKADRGVLAVRSPVSGALVTVDGTPFGSVPTETPVGPGAHRIQVTHDGFHPADSSAVVAAGERKEVNVPLEAIDPIYKKWWFWTGVGVVVAGGVAITVAALSERSPDKGSIDPGTVSTGFIRGFHPLVSF
jgi:hypothetical protein